MSTLEGPACILKPRERERGERATDNFHLEADVARLIPQQRAEVLHLGPARTAQVLARGKKFTLFPTTLGGHAKTAATDSKNIKTWMYVEGCASIQI